MCLAEYSLIIPTFINITYMYIKILTYALLQLLIFFCLLYFNLSFWDSFFLVTQS